MKEESELVWPDALIAKMGRNQTHHNGSGLWSNMWAATSVLTADDLRKVLGRQEAVEETRTREILSRLVAKLDAMEEPLSGTCTVAQIHGAPYSGPTWDEELDEARLFLVQGK